MTKNLLLILSLTFMVFNAFAKTPDQPVYCHATIFPADQKIPQMSLSTVQIQLDPKQLRNAASFDLYEVTYKAKYQQFYPRFTLLPRAKQSSWEKEIIISEKPVADSKLEIILERFDAKEDRVAGMSLEVKLEKSFNSAYLLAPEKLGPQHWITIPKKIGEELILLSIFCQYR